MIAGCALLSAQKPEKPKAKPAARPEDPYTGGDRELLTKLGYARFAPFVLGHGHDTDDVEHVLGLENRILWVETKHFRIGSRLGRYKLSDRAERKKLRTELKALGRKLPKVKASVGSLDPWLRLHLFAHRLRLPAFLKTPVALLACL